MAGLPPNLGENPSAAQAVERRAWVRYGVSLEAACRPAKVHQDVGWWGRVVNLSAGGVGLLVRHRFRPGTLLTLELKACTGHLLCVIEVRVAHATAVNDGNSSCWFLGCAFAGPLADQEVQAVLRAEDE